MTEIMGSYVNETKDGVIEDPLFYKNKLRELLQILEEEAKKQGKL